MAIGFLGIPSAAAAKGQNSAPCLLLLQEMATPGSFLRPLPGITAPAAAALPAAAAAAQGRLPPAAAAAAGWEEPRRLGRVTRASERSLAAMRARGQQAQQAGHVNKCDCRGLKHPLALAVLHFAALRPVSSAAADACDNHLRPTTDSLLLPPPTPQPPTPPFSRFPAVALSWAVALLRDCDRQQQGVDLFGRDAFLLGRLLATLGAMCLGGRARAMNYGPGQESQACPEPGARWVPCPKAAKSSSRPQSRQSPLSDVPLSSHALPPAGTFMECCSGAPQSLPLAAAVVELVRAERVHAHPEPYVRRAALLAVAQVGSSPKGGSYCMLSCGARSTNGALWRCKQPTGALYF